MNKQLLLRKRPEGLPSSDTWELVESPIPGPKEGEVLFKILYVSLDPAMRGWMNDVRSYIPPVGIGEVMRAGTIGEVIASNNSKIKVGDYYSGWGGVQSFTTSNGEGWFKVDPKLAPLPTFIGTLGMPGFTAYFGLLDVGKPKAGETVLVSGAAGAVGSIVGQIAKIKGCRVVGIAGGPEKCQYLKEELGYDEVIDYKNEDIKDAIKSTCKEGIDIYFDNVGGEILNAALTRLNKRARVVICGAISQYNSTTNVEGPSNYLSLLVSRSRMEGFVILDYVSQFGQAAVEIGGWIANGEIKSKEQIVEGIENFHDTFLRLFNGNKKGKLILKIL